MPRKELTEASRDYTIHLAKRVHKIAFKKRAPRAIREIVKFAEKEMRTGDVRVDTALNRYIWSNGVRNIPRRVRVRFVRQKNNDDQKSKFYTLVQHVPVDSFKELQTENAA
ncbi:unnamed protein product [Moneuplotes crassus]|uniref:60S ribosomal protein L31 n=2 Tax=Euplotes crassus TaxID=5936 RepID=A0AAD2D6M1_EUPCR|nr:unnamed protein product [Moneuplotes crassus]